MPHMPPAQEPVACAGEQGMPQPPQLCASVAKRVLLYSQPSPGRPSQLLKPGLQGPTPHIPPVQTPVAFAGEQTTPQPPQLLGSFGKLLLAYSQPSAYWPSQSLKP